MAFLDELKKIVRPIDDDDDYMENDDYDEEEGFSEEFDDEPEYEEPKPAPQPKAGFARRERERHTSSYQSPADRVGGKTAMLLRYPESFEDAAAIAEELMSRRAVLMNLEHTSNEDARRLIDFLSGVAFALGGKIKRFSSRAYILTPANVDLVGDSVDDLESDGLYF